MTATQKLNRRDFLRLASLATAGAIAAACAPAAATPAPKAEEQKAEAPQATAPVTVEYWFCWPGIYQEKQRKILDTFENEIGGKIKVHDLSVPTNIRDKLLTAVAAGVSPDATACFGDIVSLAAKGAFLPIDEYVASSKIIQLDALYQARVKACYWRNKMFGFPYNCSAEILLLNRQIFEEAGLDATKQIETWAEFTDASKKMVKFDAQGNLTRAAFALTNWAPRHPSLYYWINGGDAYDAQADKITIDRPENVEGLQTIIDYVWNVYGDVAKADDFMAGAGTEAQGPFCTGTQAAVFAGDWDPSTYHGWCPTVKVWPALFPKGPKGKELVASGAGDFMSILRGAKNPAQAYQLIEWMVMKGNKMWTEAGVDTNCVKKDAGIVRSDWPDIFGDKAAELSKWWAQSAELARPVENFPAYGFMVNELNRVHDLAIHKKMTAAEALAEAQKNVVEEQDKYTVP
jgi:ABC-type glycerol-3-phosphate transport system substrate-binding protein